MPIFTKSVVSTLSAASAADLQTVGTGRRIALKTALAVIGSGLVAWPAVQAIAQGKPARKGAPRVVSVGAGVTEIVYALGAESQLVGIDTSSMYPPAPTKALPKVGYQRTLTAEGVISLAPQVLLAGHEAGPPTVLKQVAAAGIQVVNIDGEYSFEGLVRRIQLVATATGRVDEGRQLVDTLNTKWKAVQARIAAAPLRSAAGKPLRVACLMRHGATTMAAGRGTGADAMLKLAGATNAFGDAFENYKPLSAESLAHVAPDAIVGTIDDVEIAGDKQKLLATPGLSLTPAGRDGKVALLDIVLLLGFGPRLPQAVEGLYDALRA